MWEQARALLMHQNNDPSTQRHHKETRDHMRKGDQRKEAHRLADRTFPLSPLSLGAIRLGW